MKKIVLVLILFLFPAAAGWADEYVLVMSKEDNVCQHMLGLYNEDLRKYGKIKYDEHEEFTAIKWEEKTFKLKSVGELPSSARIENARVAIFDINNDSKEEVIVNTEPMLGGYPTDDYDIFPLDILGMLNENEIVNGELYFSKVLNNLNSAHGVPVNVYDLSEEEIKKLPNRTIKHIEATKKRGDKDNFFVGWNHKINFLKIKNLFHINFEGPRDIGPGESYDKVEQYSIISELQKDNTLKNQCLYLIKKDKPSKRRTK